MFNGEGSKCGQFSQLTADGINCGETFQSKLDISERI